MIHNPSNLYAGNAVLLNSTPYVQYGLKQQAIKQAKDEALDKYFGEQLAKATPSGMRNKEIPALIAAKGKYQKYFMANKDAIKNPAKDGGKAWGEFQGINGQMNDIIASSKIAHEGEKMGASIFYDPDKKERVTSSSLDDWRKHQEPTHKVVNGEIVENKFDPIDNPTGHQDFDMASLQYNPKLYETREMENIFKGLGQQIKPTDFNVKNEAVILPDGKKSQFDFMQTKTAKFDDVQKKKIGDIAKNAYSTDKRLAYTFDKSHSFENGNPIHEEDFEELNDIHKKYYGNDINNPEELFAAVTIKMKDNEVVQPPTRVTNTDAVTAHRDAQALKMEGIRNKHSLDRLKVTASLKGTKDNEDDLVSADAVLRNVYDIINEGEKLTSAKNVLSKSVGQKGETVISISDPNVLKAFSNIKKDGNTPIPPDAVTFDKDKDQINLVYNEFTRPDKTVMAKTVIPMSGRDYVKLKVRETYPSKDIGEINNIVDKVITKSGGLYKALQTIVKGQPETNQKKKVYNPKTGNYE